jgi:hypothetical protein
LRPKPRVRQQHRPHGKVIGPDFIPVPIGSRFEIQFVHIFEMREGKNCQGNGVRDLEVGIGLGSYDRWGKSG